MVRRILFLLMTTIASAAMAADDGGYPFVTFDSEGSQRGEQIYFGLSIDGNRWEALNGREPVLVSELGEKGARDPYLLRAENGKFYLLATDLSIFLNPDWKRAVQKGSRSILVWESDDLVHWSTPRLVEVAPPDAGCTLAPEAIYDPERKEYLVYWASPTKGDGYRKQRIWGAWTQDFHTFGAPFIYIEKPTTIIDTDIVRGDDGKYYRFTKDEKHKAITMEVCDHVVGDWQNVPGFTLGEQTGYEGPTCFKLKPTEIGQPATWCLLLDAYARHAGYQPFVTGELASGNFAPGGGFKFPFRFRHGSVLPLSATEYERLKTNFGRAKDAGGTS